MHSPPPQSTEGINAQVLELLLVDLISKHRGLSAQELHVLCQGFIRGYMRVTAGIIGSRDDE